jgi:kinetochore protein Nuf2
MNTSTNTSQANNIYSFPTLKNSEIIQCLNELNIPIQESDLQAPHPNSVRNVFENFVELLMGEPLADLLQPQFDPLSKLSYPELYEESIPEVVFMRIMYVTFYRRYEIKSKEPC